MTQEKRWQAQYDQMMALNISWTRCRYNYGSKNKHTKGLTLCVPGFDKRNEIFDIVAQNWEFEAD